jgi:CheY-like chemotaxis protein
MNNQQHVVLFVEDDPADARLVTRAFQKVGLPGILMRVANGDDAVAYLNGNPPYDDRKSHPLPMLLLLDLKLPRRSGLEVLQWVRASHEPLRRVPIIILSSSRQRSDINKAYDAGANSYLSKPEASDQLLALAETFKAYWMNLNEKPTLGQVV